LTPTRTLFEKRVLDSPKLSKNIDKYIFLKVLERGSGEKLLSRSFSPAFSSLSYKLQFDNYAIA